MSQKLFFSMDVASPAVYQANAQEFFTKALIGNDRSTSYMRQVINVKSKTRIGSLEFDDVIQQAGCTFSSTNSDLTSKEMEAKPLSIGVEVCQSDVESSFLAQWMSGGSAKVDFTPARFMNHYYERLASTLSANLETLTWRGDTAGATSTYLDYADGLEKLFAFASIPANQRITGTTVTSSNVIAELTKVYNAIPKALRKNKKAISWFVSSNIADAYRLAVASASAETFTRQDPELSFLGYKLIVGEGMSDNVMTFSRTSNYIFLTDLVSDPEELTTINMKQTTGDRKLRTISDFKFGVNYVNESEFVVYNIPKQS